MPKVKKKKKGKRLTREAVATAALELVDQEGLHSLSMRRVAARLDVDPMALYRTVPDRNGMIGDVARLLLDEIDTTEQAGESWHQTMRRVATSERVMALRHPQAYPLVAMAPTHEDPGLSHAYRVMRLVTKSGLSEEAFFDMWIVADAWTTGFLLLETNVLVHEALRAAAGAPDQPDSDWADKMASTVSEDAFWHGLDLIYSGLAMAFESKGGVSA